jgi:hypothetical protein
VDDIDLKRLNDLDALQLWRQVKAVCADFPNEFRLTREERQQLAARNCQHERPLKAQMEIEDILSDAEQDADGFEWRDTTVSEFKLEYATLAKYSTAQIARALDKLGICAERKRMDGKITKLRRLPCHKWWKRGQAVG